MPRTAQRGLLLRKIIYIIELLLLGTKNEISSDSSSMVLEITYDLLELYQEISRRRYTVPRTISAGRHHVTNDEPDYGLSRACFYDRWLALRRRRHRWLALWG
ncbi:hypothetical protein L211DRAFT_465357 [Terfezia boudieri ATCC MYA-4762]|uniref:Uncharacterized protein n=1 Tax=Terfezia boudieri ATCC MYA-4762 TaxID=1051890 RepID=A0A3N4M368_9PEZI|nr:hypothetical protein L211DRAFT_465357 [Terfezia boudieri ATCC MYA-4762]